LVQLGLDPQYPGLCFLMVRPWRTGVHRRPPGMPARLLRARCPPSPCGRLSRPPTTTGTPPHLRAISRRRACPPPAWLAGGRGGFGMVPMFTTDRSAGEAPSFSPAASPRVRRSSSSWPPVRPGLPSRESSRPRDVRCAPARIHQVGAGSGLEGV
jgi:hypothetical protein